jgi:hypothetical protein
VFGEDCRRAHAAAALDGIDLTQSSNHFLESTILVGPTNSQAVYFTGFFDIIFEIDMEAGTISYRM